MDFLASLPGDVFGAAIPALILLTLVVFVHEMGHFLVARWCGIRVAAFSVGFGPELIGFNDRRGTRWKISAVPLGGYVKFEGDDNAASIPDPQMLATTPPAERAGLFHFAPLWKRVAVVAAGPVTNFLLSILVFAAVFTFVGRPFAPAVAVSVVEGSAAEAAGFKAGDRVIRVDGERIQSFSDLQSKVMLSADTPMEILIERGGEELTLEATPRREERPNRLGGNQRIGVLGITATAPQLTRDDPITALAQGARETRQIVSRTLTYIGRLLTGRESTEQLSGPIGIGRVSGVVASEGGVTGLVYLMAVLSTSIGLFNLFPVPMLDGGHLFFYLVEGIRGRPLSPRVQDLGFRIGFALVIMMFIFVTFNDIANLSGIFQSS